MNLCVRSWVLGVRTITWIVFIGFHYFWYMCHFGQDLGWDWRWASYIIKYAHYGCSCDLCVFGIPEVNFTARVYKLNIQRDLMGTHDIRPGSCWISIFVFFLIFYAFINEPECSVMSVWCPGDNLNCFQWILMIFNVIWVKIIDGIEYEHHISLNMRIMADHVTSAFLAFLKSIFQLDPSNFACRT